MPRLDNARWEKVAQEVADGKSAIDSYTSAGYKGNTSHASRLVAKPEIRARIEELQAEATNRVVTKLEINLQTLTEMLHEDRALAHKVGQANAAREASVSIGKLYGFAFDAKEAPAPAQTDRTNVVDVDFNKMARK